MKTRITKAEYIQLEGIFSLLKYHADKITDCNKAAAEILKDGTAGEDDYDTTYPLQDNMWEQPELLKPFLEKAGIKIDEG